MSFPRTSSEPSILRHLDQVRSSCGRRSFLRGIWFWSLYKACSLILPRPLLAAHRSPLRAVSALRGRVVRVRDDRMLGSDGKVSTSTILAHLTRSLELLTGSKGIGAWRSLFRPEDRVAIKVNAMGGPKIATHPDIAKAISIGLEQCGVSPDQILIWDRSSSELRRAGYTLRSNGSGPYCFGTDALGYEALPRIHGRIGSCFSPILTKWATALIDVPVLKDHDLAGVSLSMKNLFGVIHNPNKYHDSGCAPYLVDLLSFPLIQERLRLIVCDALRAQCHGGPAYVPRWNWPYRGLLIGTDPVAVDRIGAQIIEDRRRQLGMASLKAEGRPPAHIHLAHEAGLGEGTLEGIHLLEA